MPRVAFATCQAFPQGYPDDLLAYPPCRARGIEPVPAIWDDPSVDWSGFDAVLLRTTWDYYKHAPAFLQWLDSLPCPVWNPPGIVRWNASKTYLFDLEAWGVPIVPTVRFAPPEDLAGTLAAKGWKEAVVKPVVSAGAWRTWRVRPDNAEAVGAEVHALGGLWLLQPFVFEILTKGEWSLLFFGGEPSHSLRKVPAEADFRVQEEFGGRVLPERAPERVWDVGRAALQAVGETLPYARIDVVDSAAGPWLVEAELIEPEVFLRADPGAPERFAAALHAALG